LWAESPCNPILRLTDLAAVAGIAHRAGAQFVVDSTLATPIATRPLTLGADRVLHSLTKYLNGHGDALGGVVIGRREPLAELCRQALIHFGGPLSPFNAWLIRRGLHTLSFRMRAHQESALKVAKSLESHPAIKAVITISAADLGAGGFQMIPPEKRNDAISSLAAALAAEGMAPLAGTTPERLANEVFPMRSSGIS